MQELLHSHYILKGIKLLLYLKEITHIVPDVVYLIMNKYWSFRLEPVFVIYVPEDDINFMTCGWDNVIAKFKGVYHDLCCYNQYSLGDLIFQVIRNKIFTSTTPLWAYNFSTYPCGLLISGPLWENRYHSVRDDDYNGIQVLNGFVYGNIVYTDRMNKLYSYTDYVQEWLTRALNDDKFLAIQNRIL